MPDPVDPAYHTLAVYRGPIRKSRLKPELTAASFEHFTISARREYLHRWLTTLEAMKTLGYSREKSARQDRVRMEDMDEPFILSELENPRTDEGPRLSVLADPLYVYE